MIAKTANDILSHVPGIFKRVAATHGGEWAGPCPWCYGTDRFRVWPYREGGENVYWCRGCGACGDLIQFLRDYKGLSFIEACKVSGQEPRGKTGKKQLNLLRSRSMVQALEPEQLSLLETLTMIAFHMQAALTYPRVQAYLAYRHIPLEVARSYEMGYLPPITETNRSVYDRDPLLRMWSDSLITPTLTATGGIGYVARKLSLWEEGIDEDTHKALLAEKHIPRIIKTGNPGWLWYPDDISRSVIMVEGKFEVYALVAAGINPNNVIGVLTNNANVDWLPAQVRCVLVAFNGDERGCAGANRLARELTFAGIQSVLCTPPGHDQLGMDWSARWRTAGHEGLAILFEKWEHLSPLHSSLTAS